MKKYNEPQIQIILLEETDVIIVSFGGGDKETDVEPWDL